MYTRPSIEITRVPRVYSAEGLAVSKDVALDLIIMAVERVEGPDPTTFVAKKSAPVPDNDNDDNDKVDNNDPDQSEENKEEEKETTPKVFSFCYNLLIQSNVNISSMFS